MNYQANIDIKFEIILFSKEMLSENPVTYNSIFIHYCHSSSPTRHPKNNSTLYWGTFYVGS